MIGSMNMNNYTDETTRLFKLKMQLQDKGETILVRNKIVELNLRLVPHVLKKYRPYTDDQLQIGYIGLILAVDTYNADKNVPFSSYACFCIERQLQLEYKKRMATFEEAALRDGRRLESLDGTTHLPNGDEIENSEVILDTKAEAEMNSFIEDNSLDFMCEHIIKPCIKSVSSAGRHMKSKIDFDKWEKLEFMYVLELAHEDSQKQRFNLTQMAKACNVSVQNIRNRHERVMELLFQRMWNYMVLPFNDLLERFRGSARIPERLLCLAPGKTTGWCLFENGKLTKWGQIEDCFDDNNVDVTKLYDLFAEVQPDFILYEDYKVYSHKLDRHSFNPVFTVRLIGVIETYCQMEGVATHKQMATTAKNFCTDDKLKQWGFWQKGMRHSRDAIRHGCYFLLFYKRGQNIL